MHENLSVTIQFSNMAGIHGTFDSLQGLKQLVSLSVRGTNVIGDIGALAELPLLEQLDIGDTSISGDFNFLSNMVRPFPSLYAFFAPNTLMSGSLAPLVEIPSLRKVDLANNKFTGNSTVSQ